MPLRTLLVHGRDDDLLPSRVDVASILARAHGARVVVLFPLQGEAGAYLHAEHASAAVVARHIKAERLRAVRIGTRVTRRMTSQGIQADWLVAEGPAHEILATRSVMADILVMSWSEADWVSPQASSVVVAAGRPVLVVPPVCSVEPGTRRVLLAWSGSRESARAIQDALPFLEKAEKVLLFSAGDAAQCAAGVADAASYLTAHNIAVQRDHCALRGPDAGQAILRAARRHEVDLIVMGAYGHSRLHEWTFGGATRTVLRSMTVPTLLSH